jgi:phytol kinase
MRGCARRSCETLGSSQVAVAMESLFTFLQRNTPPIYVIVALEPVSLIWAYACLAFAGYLKSERNVKTGYTRKTFHVLTFLTAAALQVTAGLPLVCLFGGMTTLVLAYALFRGDGDPLYEAIAREKDEPYRTYYIVIPYLATLVGGVAGNVWFGPAVIIGYMVGGPGDAAGEPVGTRWGKHRYIVPTLSQVKTTRSIEGSIGVFIASLIAIVVGMLLTPDFTFSARSFLTILAIASVSTLLEAVSPHGWDNATMQLAPALMAARLL